ncbi:Uncharacterized protein HZ326_31570 [Fusarium oxysporum f. sp. albedinis]|nr:Uncharacterized protein HZ326_31570 [Fusarium oxysporum f. sp. albedinis]
MNRVVSSALPTLYTRLCFFSQYRIPVCQKCQHACLANEVATHLAKKHPEIEPGARRRLVDDTKVIPNILQSRVELSQLPCSTHLPARKKKVSPYKMPNFTYTVFDQN